MPLTGTDSDVSGIFEPLLDMGRGRNPVNRVTRLSAYGHPFCGELDAGVAMDRGNVTKHWESRAPTRGSIYTIDNSRRLDLFWTACKEFSIPMEVRHVWSPMRFFPWFRETLTTWLYSMTKDHMNKHQKEYRQFLTDIGPEVFKRPLLTNRNAITTGWKRVGRVSRDNTKARESILEEDLAKNVANKR